MITKRLKLIEITWNDLEHIHRLNSLPEVDQFNTLGIPKNIDDTRRAIQSSIEDQSNEERSEFAWGVWFENDFVGMLGLFVGARKFQSGEFYYKILPNFWGNGFATEAAQAVINFCFEELKLHRLEAGVATENVASIKVLEKLGMMREGVGRKILPIRGEWVDNYRYSILENDPRSYASAG